MLTLAHLTIGIAAMTVVTIAALQDIRERLIANRSVVLLLGSGALYHMAIAGGFADWLVIAGGAFASAAAVMSVGFAVWRLGGLGGGDVKLLAAAAFFVGVEGITVLLVATALAGGLLAIVHLLLTRLAPIVVMHFAGPSFSGPDQQSRSLPYGVAIATGFACAVIPSLPILIG